MELDIKTSTRSSISSPHSARTSTRSGTSSSHSDRTSTRSSISASVLDLVLVPHTRLDAATSKLLTKHGVCGVIKWADSARSD